MQTYTAGTPLLKGEAGVRSLEADVSFYAAERKTYLDLLKQYYLADTTATAMQNLQQLLAAETDIESRYELVFAQLANKEGSTAFETLANMEFTLPDNDIVRYNYYQMKDLLPVLIDLNCEEVEWEAIDKSKVIELSENNDELPGALAKAIRMHYDESYTYPEPIYINESIASKSTTAAKISKSAAIADKQIFKVSPNPANDFVIVEYTIDKIAKEVVFLVYDIQGRLQLTQQLKNLTNQSLVDISKLTNGTYQCKLVTDGHQKAVAKLIVQH